MQGPLHFPSQELVDYNEPPLPCELQIFKPWHFLTNQLCMMKSGYLFFPHIVILASSNHWPLLAKRCWPGYLDKKRFLAEGAGFHCHDLLQTERWRLAKAPQTF